MNCFYQRFFARSYEPLIGQARRIALPVAILLASAAAAAQQYPAQPVRVILPFAPGGSLDITMRTVGAKLTESLGQPVIIDNRSGAAGQVGIQAVVRSPADGYTLVTTPSGPISITGHLQKLPYDPAKDLVSVAMLAMVPAGIAVNASLPIHSLGEFIKYSKGKSDGVSYGVSAIGTHMHLAGELLKSMTGANLVAVAYRGTAPAVTALVSGEVPAAVADLATLLPQARGGRIRILAVVNSTRTSTAPELPTFAESGVPGYGADAWIGMFAPTGVPQNIIARLNADVARALALADVRQTLEKAGLEPAPMKPEDMSRFVADDIAKWGKVIREANIKIN